MSLVPVYVRGSDGLYYKNPVIHGDGWFICFDDADPPEIVIRRKLIKRSGMKSKDYAEQLLQSLNVPFEIRRKGEYAMRVFGGKLYHAQSYFFDLTGPFPSASIQSAGKENYEWSCVIFGDQGR
jgi:hypothetical protein